MHKPDELVLAQQCSDALHSKDTLAQSMGMQIKSIEPSVAQIAMTITDTMLNGHGTCHGGMIFSLADTAFAHACNSRNLANVAMDCRIDFLAPAYAGDELLATAKATHQGRKSSLYEVVVSNQEDKVIARFQGRSYYINRTVLQDETE